MSQALAPKPKLDRTGIGRLVQVVFIIALDAAILLAAAGTWSWPAAWVYLGMRTLAFLFFGTLLLRINPEIINERGRLPRDMKRWDKIFAVAYTPLVLALPLVAGLDFRFEWSAVPLWLQIVGAVGMVPAVILPYWAMIVNAYLTTTVRVQTDREHRVVSTGPYRYVRHPMYAGMILMAFSMPLLLDSWWTLIPGILSILVISGRTQKEDQLLQGELPGYAEYARQVRYRLLPGIW
jgi:protein-S-isoprenylcysteine O-methyltransferase Ste14